MLLFLKRINSVMVSDRGALCGNAPALCTLEHRIPTPTGIAHEAPAPRCVHSSPRYRENTAASAGPTGRVSACSREIAGSSPEPYGERRDGRGVCAPAGSGQGSGRRARPVSASACRASDPGRALWPGEVRTGAGRSPRGSRGAGGARGRAGPPRAQGWAERGGLRPPLPPPRAPGAQAGPGPRAPRRSARGGGAERLRDMEGARPEAPAPGPV